jgi:DNA-binding FadR family transcriptional regulator
VEEQAARLVHRTIHAHVVDLLGHRIVSGGYAVGEQLPNEAELADRLEVSRGIVREAVRVLVAKRLVSSRPRLGTVVLERTSWNLLDPDVLRWGSADDRFLVDLLDLRLLVEPGAARLAAVRAKEAERQRLAAAFDRMSQSADGVALDNEEFVAADLEFHLCLLQATGNPLVAHLGDVLAAALQRGMRETSHAPDSVGESLPLHRAVLDAVVAGQPDRAEEAMRFLIEQTTLLV